VQDVVEAVSGFPAVVLEPLDAEVLHRRPQAVQSGFDPSLLDGDRFLRRIIRIGHVLHLLDGRHEPAEADVAGVGHDGPVFPVD